jgi:iron(III) transport system substrate-binding protein
MNLRIKWKQTGISLMTVIMAITAAACANTTQTTSSSESSAAPSAAATSTPKPSEEATKSSEKPKLGGEITVYLNDFDEIIAPMFEKATGVKLNIVSGNGAEIMSRIEAEKGNPHWDVVWMDAMPSIYNLGKNGQLLEGWSPVNIGNLTDFAKSLVPSNKSFVPTGAHAAGVIIYNSKNLPAAQAPKTWADLNKPEYKNALGMADPAVAAPAYPFVAWFFQSKGIDGGKAYFDAMLKNGTRVYPKNPNVAKALTGGEIKMAALQESNAYTLKATEPAMEIVWPEEGAPASVRVAAIQKGSKNIEASKAFLEFLLNPATQQELIDKGEESYFEPSATGVTTKPNRAKNVKLVVADAPWAADNEAAIKTWFADKAVK